MTSQADLHLDRVLDKYDVRFNPNRMANQKILCPVHDEKVPSCSVSLAEGLWHCFSCGASGDSITLIERKEQVDFQAALSILAGIAGISDGDVRKARRKGNAVSDRSGIVRGNRSPVPSGRRGKRVEWT